VAIYFRSGTTQSGTAFTWVRNSSLGSTVMLLVDLKKVKVRPVV
jgi:hypothetical protein